jgi:hypothetical protein
MAETRKDYIAPVGYHARMAVQTPDPNIENPDAPEVAEPEQPSFSPQPGTEIQEPPPAPVEVPQPGLDRPEVAQPTVPRPDVLPEP